MALESHAFTSNVANFHVSFLLPTIYAMLLQNLPRWGNRSTEYCREPWSVLTARWRLQYCRYPLENSDCPLRGKYILVCVKERILGICVRFENLRENSTNAKSTSKATIFKPRISSCYILQACWVPSVSKATGHLYKRSLSCYLTPCTPRSSVKCFKMFPMNRARYDSAISNFSLSIRFLAGSTRSHFP